MYIHEARALATTRISKLTYFYYLTMLKLRLLICVLSYTVLDVFGNPPDLGIFEKFQQNDYKIKFERGHVVSYDKRIMRRYEFITFKYNRTCAAVNLTAQFNVDIANESEIITQAYKYMSNEYRYFPMRFQINFCFALSRNIAGAKTSLNCGNFTGCPLLKGKIIHMCNWTPDESKLPPLIPNGRYMLELQTLYRDTEISMVQVFLEVYRPFSIPN